MKLIKRIWLFVAPLVWTALFLLAVAFGGHFWSGKLPAWMVSAVPALKGLAPDCADSGALVQPNQWLTLGKRPAAGQPADMALVFVHGYHGTAAGWETLAGVLNEGLNQQGETARAYFVCYPSQESTAFALSAEAVGKAGALAPEGVTKDAPVFFIGHSFGGIAIKNYLLTNIERVDPKRINVITINTPHHGTPASLLRYFTSESLLHEFATTRDISILPDLGQPETKLESLLSKQLWPINIHTITGTYVSSPVSAFLGGTFIAQSDGLVPARSAHFDVPRDLPLFPTKYIDGLPYDCSKVTTRDDQGNFLTQDWQFTFTRPLSYGDIFHVNIHHSPTVTRLINKILSDPKNLSLFNDCADLTPDRELNMDQYRPYAWALLALPLALLVAGALLLRRSLGEPGQGIMVVLYALAASLCVYVLSYFVPMGIFLAVGQHSLSGVWLSAIQAFSEEVFLMLWFTYFLRQQQDRPEYVETESFRYALLFGFTVAMVEQALFVGATGGTMVLLTLVRLVLASAPRLAFAWVTAWAFHKRATFARLPATGKWRSLPNLLTYLFLLLLPPILHTLYSAMFFNVTTMPEAISLYLMLVLTGATLALTGRLNARAQAQKAKQGAA